MTHGVRTYGASAFLVGWGLGTSTGESRNESDDERLHLRTKVTSSARSGTWHLLGKLRPNQIKSNPCHVGRRRKSSPVVDAAAKHKMKGRQPGRDTRRAGSAGEGERSLCHITLTRADKEDDDPRRKQLEL
jgi:hypothetical protein